jgi:hypothetical protein
MNLRLVGTRGIEHKFEKTIVRSYELKMRIKKMKQLWARLGKISKAGETNENQ